MSLFVQLPSNDKRSYIVLEFVRAFFFMFIFGSVMNFRVLGRSIECEKGSFKRYFLLVCFVERRLERVGHEVRDRNEGGQ